MCGIAGIYGVEKLNDPKTIVAKMVSALRHRGPDANGVTQVNATVLGHARLSIIDLDSSSNQPFTSVDGRYTLCFNGEIYNYQKIRSELPNYNFQTNSDTEVLLAALIEWGMPALQKVNGMFAFALYDGQENRLFLARDRMGIKPLYVYFSNQEIVFASEIRSLLESGLVPKKLNHAVIPEYLQYQCIHAPNTLIENVEMLDAGSYYEISESGVNKSEYWKPWQEMHQDRDPIHIKKNIRELFTSSVEQRLISDVPIGAFLSGGIDSSLIVGVAAERLGTKLDTFNISFQEEKYSEAKYARIVAKKFGANHHEIVLKPELFLESLPEAVQSIDHPSGDGPNSWIVSRETKKQGITVALSGLGGDEVFAGYDVFKNIPAIADQSWLLSFPMLLRRLASLAVVFKDKGVKGRKMAEVLTQDYFDLASLYPIFRKVLLDSDIKKLLPQGSDVNRVQLIIKNLESYVGFSKLPTLSRISISEFHTYMQNVLLRDADQMSMAHALEVRVPFLDHRLVEYCMHIPDQVKFPHTPKKLLIDTFPDILPNEIVNREKMGFVLPWEHWMKGELKEYCEESLSYLKEANCVSLSGLDQLWNRFLRNDKLVTWSRIWPLIVLAQWMKTNQIEA